MHSKSKLLAVLLLSSAMVGCSSSNDQADSAGNVKTDSVTPQASAPQAAAPVAGPFYEPTPEPPIAYDSPPTAAPKGTPPYEPTHAIPATLIFYDSYCGFRYEVPAEITKSTIQLKQPLPQLDSSSFLENSYTTGRVDYADPTTGERFRRLAKVDYSKNVVSWNGKALRMSDPPIEGTYARREEPGAAVDAELPLPGSATAVAVGGGGRYLVVAMAAARLTAVIDVREAAVRKIIPTSTEDFTVAAGMTRFVIVDRGKKTVSRWSFATLVEERRSPLSTKLAEIAEAAVGSSSEGPLWIVGPLGGKSADLVESFDLETLAPQIVRRDPSTRMSHSNPKPYNTQLTTDHAGAVLCVSSDDGTTWIFRTESGVLKAERAGQANDERTLLADGKHLTSDGEIRLIARNQDHSYCLERAEYSRAFDGGSGWFTAHYADPVYQDGVPIPRLLELGFHRDLNPYPDALLRLERLGRDVALLDKTRELKDRSLPTFSERIRYLPTEKTFVLVTRYPERVLLKRFDLEAAATANAGKVAITSLPATTEFQVDQPWQYQVAAQSPRGGLQYRLEVADSTMKISPTGLVEWVGRSNWAPTRLVVRVTDAAGAWALQEVKLTTPDRSPASTATGRPATVQSRPPAITSLSPTTKRRGAYAASTGSPAASVAPAASTPAAAAPPRAVDIPFPPPKMIEASADGPSGDGRLPADAGLPRPTTIIGLPGRFDDLRVGGGGRYLVTLHAAAGRLVVIDVVRRAVVRYLPISDSDVHFAAGRRKLVVAHGFSGAIARYDLETGALEKSAVIPGIPFFGLAMGSDSEGPLMIVGEGLRNYRGARLCDLETLELFGRSYQMAPAPRASADGTTFVGCDGNALSYHLLSVYGKEVDVHPGSSNSSFVLSVPGVDGRYIYDSQGLFKLPAHDLHRTSEQNPGLTFHLPAASGKLFLRLSVESAGGQPAARSGPTLSLYAEGYEKPLRVLDDVAAVPRPMRVERPWGREYRLDQQIMLLPAARALVTTGDDDSRLLIQDFDVAAELAKSNERFLFVNSPIPKVIAKDQKLTFQIEAKATYPPIKFSGRHLPDGAAISPTGLVEWTNVDGSSLTHFVVTIQDARGTFDYPFEISLLKGDPPATAFAPTSPAAAPPALNPAAAVMRTWSSPDGKFKIEATMTGVLNGRIILKTVEGKRIDVTLQQISPADQEFVKKHYPDLK